MRQRSGVRRNWADRLRWWRRLSGRLESRQLRRWGWSATSVLFRLPLLVLVTTGRWSGRERFTPLSYLREGDGILIAGGAGGQRATPDWVANLRANPRCRVVLERRQSNAIARELHDEERVAALARLATLWPRVARYEALAGRVVPVFVIERDDGE